MPRKTTRQLPPAPQFASIAEATAAGQELSKHVALARLLNRDDANTLALAAGLGARLDQYHVNKIGPGQEEAPTLLVRSIVIGAKDSFNFLIRHADLNQSCRFAVPVNANSPMGAKHIITGTALDAADWREIELGEKDYFTALLLAGARASNHIDAKRIRQEAHNARRRVAYAAKKPAA